MTKESKIISLLPSWYPFRAVAFAGVIFNKKNDELSDKIIRHEHIHFEQQKELLWGGFLVLYLVEFLLRFLWLRRFKEAYRAISFEKEAYEFDCSKNYLSIRSKFFWFEYLKIDVTNFIKTKWPFLIAIAFLLFVTYNQYKAWFPKNTETKVSAQAKLKINELGQNALAEMKKNESWENADTLTAGDYLQAFESNHLKASNKYSGKPIFIFGKVHAITGETYYDSQPHIELLDHFNVPSIYAYYKPSEERKLSQIEPGQIILCKCKGSDYSIVAKLKECEIFP